MVLVIYLRDALLGAYRCLVVEAVANAEDEGCVTEDL